MSVNNVKGHLPSNSGKSQTVTVYETNIIALRTTAVSRGTSHQVRTNTVSML